MPSKRVLIVSEAPLVRTFVEATASKLKEEADIQFDCLLTGKTDNNAVESLRKTFRNVMVNDYPKGVLRYVPKLRFFQMLNGLRNMAKSLGTYDIIHIHYHHYYYSFIAEILRKKTNRLYITFFGSDFNQITEFEHKGNIKTVNLADGIFATNEVFLEKIVRRYAVSKRDKHIGILMPLMDNLDSFDRFLNNNTRESAKRSWNIRNKLIVCGYNASPVVQHHVIIDSLNAISESLREYDIILPMTYGWRSEETRQKVRSMLDNASFNYQILSDYLPTEKLQALRLASDIFVSIPTKDQMSASMLEHLAAGSVVITGRWLPYEGLSRKGLYFILIDTPAELPRVLKDVITNLHEHKERAKTNREIVLTMMSWKTIRGNWYKHYSITKAKEI